MTTLFALILALLPIALLGTMRQVQDFTGGSLYRPVFEGMPHGIPQRITPSDFDGTDWVDADGYLKPGTPLKADGTPAGSVVDETAESVIPYSTQIAESGSTEDLAAAPDGDIAVSKRGEIVQDYVEGNLGRALTANEKAAINASGRFTLIAAP